MSLKCIATCVVDFDTNLNVVIKDRYIKIVGWKSEVVRLYVMFDIRRLVWFVKKSSYKAL